jgi:uncharacterized membrane protein YgdD (TMEM256/DUF423 family)
MNQRTTLVIAALLGAFAVILGASGAHGLKDQLDTRHTTHIFELANRYHFYHVFALLAAGILMNYHGSKRLRYAALFFVLGTLCFSGSLYTMSFVKLSLLGPVTPLGGLLLIVGWIFMALAFLGKLKVESLKFKV